nr:patatin-like phospholipase family protein [uncultured Rhodopila sp.]
MSDRTARLLNSLKLHARTPDGWLYRHPLSSARRAEEDKARAERARDLRGAFPLADGKSIEALTSICSLMSVPAGTALIWEGEQPEAVYIVMTGQFGAYHAAGGGRAMLDRFGAGDVIGDVGFFTGEAHSVGVRALRNSEVLRISKADLHAAAARCHGVLLAVCSGAVQRLQRGQAAVARLPKCHTFCFVPADEATDIRPIVQKIAACLEAFGTVVIVAGKQKSERTSAWFSDIEKHSDFVLLQADGDPTPWTRFCVRQSDRIVLVANGDGEPGTVRLDVPHTTPLALMLLWQDAIVPGKTTGWLAAVNPSRHFHIRSSADIERASRLIAERGLGLVLSGGGAKAMAHIGVIQALREHDIQIDAVGGTSVGAIVSAVFALEWNLTTTVRALAMAFNRRKFTDFAVPWTALYSERAFVRTLGHCFGTMAMEDAPIPLFCVSTNITEGVSAVHRTGPLVTWLRATTAVPGICPPILEGNAVYVDGGVLNNMPIEGIHGFGVASVIAVDVGSMERDARSGGETGLPGILDLLWRVGTIGSDTAANPIRDGRDVLLKPAVGDIGIFDWNAHEKVIAAGHQAALENMDQIKAALGRVR